MLLLGRQEEQRQERSECREQHDDERVHTHDDAEQGRHRSAGRPDAHELVEGELHAAALDMLACDLAQLGEDPGCLLFGVLVTFMVDVAALGEDAQLPGDEKRHDAQRQHRDDQGIRDTVEEIGDYGLVHCYHNPPLSNQLDLISTPLE